MDELVGLLCVVAAFTVWLTAAVHRAIGDGRRILRDAPWPEVDESMRRHPAGKGRRA